MRSDKSNLIVDKSFDFALKVIKYCRLLEQGRNFVIANQLLKSGTSIGANVFEAQNAESPQDFIHKMKIAAKEATETLYWLKLCSHFEELELDNTLIVEVSSIIKIISKIVVTAKQKMK